MVINCRIRFTVESFVEIYRGFDLSARVDSYCFRSKRNESGEVEKRKKKKKKKKKRKELSRPKG